MRLDGPGILQAANIAAGAVTQRAVTNSTAVNGTSTSATFVDVDAVKCAVTITTTGGDLLVIWNSSAQDNTSTNNIWAVALSLDGAAEVAVFGQRSTFAGIGTPFTLAYLFTGLAAGSHTVKARWSIQGGDTIANGGRSYMTAIELKR